MKPAHGLDVPRVRRHLAVLPTEAAEQSVEVAAMDLSAGEIAFVEQRCRDLLVPFDGDPRLPRLRRRSK